MLMRVVCSCLPVLCSCLPVLPLSAASVEWSKVLAAPNFAHSLVTFSCGGGKPCAEKALPKHFELRDCIKMHLKQLKAANTSLEPGKAATGASTRPVLAFSSHPWR